MSNPPAAPTSRPIDYSKWDHIDSSSDEEEEVKQTSGASQWSSEGRRGSKPSMARTSAEKEAERYSLEILKKMALRESPDGKPGEYRHGEAAREAEVLRQGRVESGSKIQLMSTGDMLHYLDVRKGWDLTECECCFDRAVSYRGQHAINLMSLDDFRQSLRLRQSTAIPCAPPVTPSIAVLEFSARVPVPAAVRELQGASLPQQFGWKIQLAPYLCAEAMILEWLAEPRVGVLMDLGRIRSRLSGILGAARLPAAAGSPEASPCSWSDYRRAASFGAVLVLVARCPRFVSLWRAQNELYLTSFPAIAAELGATRQTDGDSIASLFAQALGVKEAADLQQGFGSFVQNLLSGGLEKVHAEGKGRPVGRGLQKKGGGGSSVGTAVDGGTGGKGGQWREHLKGPVWERYVDGMRWILKHGGGEGREFKCSHCSSSSSGPGSSMPGKDIPKGMYVSGKCATDFALAFATVLSQPAYSKDGQVFVIDCNNAIKSRLEDAAIEEARERGRRKTVEVGDAGGGTRGNGGLKTTPAAGAAAAPARSGVGILHQADSTVKAGAITSLQLVPVNTNAIAAAFTYRVSCLLQWVRIYGSDSISPGRGLKGSSQSKFLSMRHPFRDLPSLLLRLGAIPKPLDESSLSFQWEEWPQGDEVAVNFPSDPTARCFGLGIVEGSGVAKRKLPIVRCRADAEFLVEAASEFLDPPGCAQCYECFKEFNRFIPALALIANFAYRPTDALFNRFVSVFPPKTSEFKQVVKALPSPFSSGHSTQFDIPLLRACVEAFPILFLLILAMKWPASLLDIDELKDRSQSETEGGGRIPVQRKRESQGSKKGGNQRGKSGQEEENDGEVWEELKVWIIAVSSGWSASLRVMVSEAPRLSDCCSRRKKRERKDVAENWLDGMWNKAAEPRFRDGFLGSSSSGGGGSWRGSSSGEGEAKGKKQELEAYSKPWPGGVNLVACLREMLLGQPCFCPPSPAASSSRAVPTASAVSTAALPKNAARLTAADVSDGDQNSSVPCKGRVCDAVKCGKAEGVGVKLRNCSGCGKAAYCSRDCQKAHWPSHKMACKAKASKV